ncbi:DUF4506 domain-containing protein [Dethiosulfovibrio sp. F2B]|uniref:DUF4506 domain-containing protein n=1 Tax=Dethiosulfovibrio faecalis TaxID=2720018 RepID=UPI001F4321A0|nr:DUF4506 domain-containing protein [Dethiosulfovibrio faecalis]MCF4152428.1 DUF4506 domain-containing protein [Dethiosulfovibrio faecalis]
MELKHCRICDKVFATVSSDICPSCWDELEEVYMNARKAIRDNWKSRWDIYSLAEALDVDEMYLEVLVDQGRLDLSVEGDGKPRCKSCGAEVYPGQEYCDSCRGKLIKGFSSDGEHKKKTMFRQERRDRKE